jgi:solute carrier family 25 phosphate transporter 23/24/25/41
MDKYDTDGDGHVNFEDFVRYVTEHEKALKLSFESLDHKRDGKFTFSIKFLGLIIDFYH